MLKEFLANKKESLLWVYQDLNPEPCTAKSTPNHHANSYFMQINIIQVSYLSTA